MADPYFLSGAPGTAANWSTAAVPVSTDTGTIDARMTGSLTGANQSAIQLARLDIYASAAYAIGSTGTPWQIGATLCNVNRPAQDGSTRAGPAMIAIDIGSAASTVNVYTSPTAGTANQEPVQLKANNSSTNINVFGGAIVGIARMLPGSTSTVGTVAASNNSQVNLGPGTTASAVDVDDNAVVYSAGTLAAATCHGPKGVLRNDSASAVTAVTLDGGVLEQLSRISGVEVTTLTVTKNGGRLKLGNDLRGVSVSTLVLNGPLVVEYASDPTQFSWTTLTTSTDPWSITFVKA